MVVCLKNDFLFKSSWPLLSRAKENVQEFHLQQDLKCTMRYALPKIFTRAKTTVLFFCNSSLSATKKKVVIILGAAWRRWISMQSGIEFFFLYSHQQRLTNKKPTRKYLYKQQRVEGWETSMKPSVTNNLFPIKSEELLWASIISQVVAAKKLCMLSKFVYNSQTKNLNHSISSTFTALDLFQKFTLAKCAETFWIVW